MHLSPERVAELNMRSPEQKWSLILAQVGQRRVDHRCTDNHIQLQAYVHVLVMFCPTTGGIV